MPVYDDVRIEMWSRLDAVVLEHLLDRDADRRTAAPDADQERRLETAAHTCTARSYRVAQQLLGRDEDLLER